MPVVPLRWVVVRDPSGSVEPKGFLSTDPKARPVEVVSWYIRRWSVEVTFAEVRRHLGVETQDAPTGQWSDLAVLRTTPCLLGLFSVVALPADALYSDGALLVRQSAWYRKEVPTFSDALAAVRLVLWRQNVFSMSGSGAERQQIPAGIFERMSSTLAKVQLS